MNIASGYKSGDTISAEQFANNGSLKVVSSPIKITREEYQAKYGETVEQAQARMAEKQGLTEQQLLDMGAKSVAPNLRTIDLNKYKSPSNNLSVVEMLLYFIAGNLLILAFFEFIRRSFYYIILGKVKPQK